MATDVAMERVLTMTQRLGHVNAADVVCQQIPQLVALVSIPREQVELLMALNKLAFDIEQIEPVAFLTDGVKDS